MVVMETEHIPQKGDDDGCTTRPPAGVDLGLVALNTGGTAGGVRGGVAAPAIETLLIG